MWMIDADKRFSYKQASDAVEKTDARLSSVVEAWTTIQFRRAVLTDDNDWLEEVSPKLRNSAQMWMSLYSDVSARYAQVQSIIRDTWKIYHMSRRYPWHGTCVSKSDHFHFVWVSFTHHCYLFEERVKQFYSAWNDLRCHLKLPQVLGGDHIKKISKRRLNEYIKHRGVHTHQWNITHNSYRTYQIVEQLAKSDDGYQDRAPNFYFESKQEIMAHIASGVGMMSEEFCDLLEGPHLLLVELVPILNKMFFETA